MLQSTIYSCFPPHNRLVTPVTGGVSLNTSVRSGPVDAGSSPSLLAVVQGQVITIRSNEMAFSLFVDAFLFSRSRSLNLGKYTKRSGTAAEYRKLFSNASKRNLIMSKNHHWYRLHKRLRFGTVFMAPEDANLGFQTQGKTFFTTHAFPVQLIFSQ